eukprot:SAG11_NODE_1215_length_5501_cov_4.190820_2_plen_145_part_00
MPWRRTHRGCRGISAPGLGREGCQGCRRARATYSRPSHRHACRSHRVFVGAAVPSPSNPLGARPHGAAHATLVGSKGGGHATLMGSEGDEGLKGKSGHSSTHTNWLTSLLACPTLPTVMRTGCDSRSRARPSTARLNVAENMAV